MKSIAAGPLGTEWLAEGCRVANPANRVEIGNAVSEWKVAESRGKFGDRDRGQRIPKGT